MYDLVETSLLGIHVLRSLAFYTLSGCGSLYSLTLLQEEVSLMIAEQDNYLCV